MKVTARMRIAPPPIADVVLAAALTAGSLPLLWLAGPGDLALPGYAGPSLAAALVSATMTVPLAWRRPYPMTVLLVVGGATVVASALPIPYVGLGLIVALYTVAVHRPRREALLGLLGVLALVVLAMLLADALRFLAGNAVVFSAAWLFGDWRRLQLARAAELRRRSAELARAQHERSRLAVGRERERISAELRDVLAHGVTEMVAQAQAAARLLRRDPALADDAMGNVDRTGRACLTELRRLVDLLRREELGTDRPPDGTVAVEEPREPAAETPASRSAPGAWADRGRWALASGGGVDRLRQRIGRLPLLVQDVALVVLLLAVELPLQWLAHPDESLAEHFAGPSAGSVAVVVAVVGVLAWRRLAPQLVLAATIGLSLLVVIWMVPAQLFAPLVALYTVGAHRPRRVSVPWLGAMLALTVAILAIDDSLAMLPGQLAVLVVVWLLGDWQRVRRDYETQLEQRTAELERTRTREAALAVAGERIRIARELHDVVAQTLGVMLVQARGARALATEDPDRAEEALQRVLEAGRASLRWLREVVEVLGEEPGGYAPQPGIEDLEGLVADFADAGLDVVLEIEGTPTPVSRGVSLSAYRIVQESLTNVLKHAEAGHAFVHLRYGEELGVEVVDDGRGPARAGRGPDRDDRGEGGGHGLLGMAERARLVGGVLESGSRSGGGFRVIAHLPVVEPASEDAGELASR
jgi:signal transduction histidine kinase